MYEHTIEMNIFEVQFVECAAGNFSHQRMHFGVCLLVLELALNNSGAMPVGVISCNRPADEAKWDDRRGYLPCLCYAVYTVQCLLW